MLLLRTKATKRGVTGVLPKGPRQRKGSQRRVDAKVVSTSKRIHNNDARHLKLHEQGGIGAGQ
jgi:hypothetical protein